MSKFNIFLKEMKEVISTVAVGTFFSTTTIGILAYSIESYKGAYPPEAPGQLIEFIESGKKYQIHSQSILKGHQTTVVLDGNTNETSFNWSKVLKDISKFANVVAIDRPGLGFSSPGVSPRTSEQISTEYASVLRELNVSGSVVLVGHGTGSYNMRFLNEKLSKQSDIEVKGMIHIDPMNEHVNKKLKETCSEIKKVLNEREKTANFVFNLSTIGLIRLISLFELKFQRELFTPESFEAFRYFNPTPRHLQGVSQEIHGTNLTEEELNQNSLPPSTSPMLIVSHGEGNQFRQFFSHLNLPDVIYDQMESIWKKGQEELFETLSDSSCKKHLTLTKCGYNIIQKNPQHIIAAVLAMVNEVENETRGGLDSLELGQCKEIK